jgi:hypothetical protein
MHGCHPVATRARQRWSGLIDARTGANPLRHRDSAAAGQSGRPPVRLLTYQAAKQVAKRDVATIEWLLDIQVSV